MKASELIKRIQEAQEWAGGDPDVVVGWINGDYRSRFDVNARQSNMVLGDPDDVSKVIIIQAYTILAPINTQVKND